MQAVYTIKNVINNKIYIGSAVNIKKRWHEHRNLLNNNNNNKHHSPILQNAWNKYGKKILNLKL